jgi:hypothetical protein
VKLFYGIGLMAIALAIAIAPHFFTCQYNGKTITTASGTTVPMKCNWSAQAEIPVGAALFLVGGSVMVSRRKETRGYLSVVGAGLGAAVLLIPTKLIGVCGSQMPCHTTMQPGLIGLGAVVAVGCVLGAVVSFTGKETVL